MSTRYAYANWEAQYLFYNESSSGEAPPPITANLTLQSTPFLVECPARGFFVYDTPTAQSNYKIHRYRQERYLSVGVVLIGTPTPKHSTSEKYLTHAKKYVPSS
jgi:hypothetical protein